MWNKGLDTRSGIIELNKLSKHIVSVDNIKGLLAIFRPVLLELPTDFNKRALMEKRSNFVNFCASFSFGIISEAKSVHILTVFTFDVWLLMK